MAFKPESALDFCPYLRLLMLGVAKIGKTSSAICTSPGPVGVILCEDETALREAKRRGAKFNYASLQYDGPNGKPAKVFQPMLDLLLEAKRNAKEGRLKTLIIDPISTFARKLLEEAFANNQTQGGKDDGRTAYQEYNRRFDHITDFAMSIPAHLIVVSHYAQVSSEMDGQMKKSGEGVVPLIPGASRNALAAKFVDVVWFDLDKEDREKRVIVTGPRGAWGPGCRSIHGTHVLPADFTQLIDTFAQDGKKSSLINRKQEKSSNATVNRQSSRQ